MLCSFEVVINAEARVLFEDNVETEVGGRSEEKHWQVGGGRRFCDVALVPESESAGTDWHPSLLRTRRWEPAPGSSPPPTISVPATKPSVPEQPRSESVNPRPPISPAPSTPEPGPPTSPMHCRI